MTIGFNRIAPTVSCDIQKYSVDIAKGLLLEKGKKKAFESHASDIKNAIKAGYISRIARYRREFEAERQIDVSHSTSADEYRSVVSYISENCGSEIVRSLAGRFLTLNGSLWADAAKEVEAGLHDSDFRLLLRCALLRYVSRTAITVGAQFAQPNLVHYRSRVSDIKKIMSNRERNFDIIEFGNPFLQYERFNNYSVFQEDANNILDKENVEGGLMYADPPYGREHYSRYYHVLEFLSHEYGTRHADIYNHRISSKYGLRSRAYSELRALVNGAWSRGMAIAISYVSDRNGERVKNRVLQIDQINECIESVYGSVRCEIIERSQYSGFSRTAESTGRSSTEMLFIAE